MVNTFAIRHLVKSAKRSKIRCKVAAIALTNNGGLLAHSNNRPFFGSKSKHTIHAEIGLITKLKKIKAFQRYRKKITVMVLRLGKYGEFREAKPCIMCQKELSPYSDNLNIFYTTDGGEIEKLW